MNPPGFRLVVRLRPIVSVLILALIQVVVRAEPPVQDFSKLRISEIYYNPPGTNSVDGEAFEFIELENTGTTDLELGGVSFTGIGATFGYPTVLGPGQFLTLGRDLARFAERFPQVRLDGLYVGKLDDSGETIRLLDPQGGVITSIMYDDHLLWPLQADGGGLSLQRVNTSPQADRPANWIAAVPTPGQALPSELFDTDADHMPDWWERAHQLSVEDPTDATLDPDGDGLSNLAEFYAGTDPHDSADCLKFTSVSFEQTPNFRLISLSFQAAANRSYSLFQQINGNDCWRTAGQFEARPTNRIETVRYAISSGAQAVLYHLATPSQPPPPCDGDPD